MMCRRLRRIQYLAEHAQELSAFEGVRRRQGSGRQKSPSVVKYLLDPDLQFQQQFPHFHDWAQDQERLVPGAPAA